MSWLAAADELSREAARRAAREELSDPRYRDAQPPLVVRVVGRAIRELLELLARAASGAPGGRLGLLLLLALLIGFVAVVLTRLAPQRGPGRAVFSVGAALTAADHRRRAEEAAAAGQWPEAVRERLRAVVRELEVRGVLDPRPGRTAGEVARDAGGAVPALRTVLDEGTRVFDEIWYGGRTADPSSYAVLVALDETVTGSRLVVA